MRLKGQLARAFCLSLFLFVMEAKAFQNSGFTHYEGLLNLHQEGPLEIAGLSNRHVADDEPLSFTCYSQKNQNLPVALILNYKVFPTASGETALIYNVSTDAEGLADQNQLKFITVPSHIPSFNGLTLAGTQVELEGSLLRRIRHTNFSPDLQVGLSYHVPSKKHLLILFKVNQNSENQASCNLRHDIQEICIEAEPEI